jgi:hypothetical protein
LSTIGFIGQGVFSLPKPLIGYGASAQPLPWLADAALDATPGRPPVSDPARQRSPSSSLPAYPWGSHTQGHDEDGLGCNNQYGRPPNDGYPPGITAPPDGCIPPSRTDANAQSSYCSGEKYDLLSAFRPGPSPQLFERFGLKT